MFDFTNTVKLRLVSFNEYIYKSVVFVLGLE